MKLYVDIGHGELLNGRPDPGAVNGNLIEHQMNIVTGNALAERMELHGHIVKVEPGDLTIDKSAMMANAWMADICISCHYNAGGGDRGEVLYAWDEGSLRLAQAVSVGMRNVGQEVVNLVKSRANSAGTAEYFGMLRIPKMPAIIIEPCFLDNVRDRQTADTVDEQKKIGICVADAICLAYGSRLNTQYTGAVTKLAGKGFIGQPDYWNQFVISTLMVDGTNVGKLLCNVTKKSDAVSAIQTLSSLGAIKSPEYWIANTVPGAKVLGSFVELLLINLVAKMNI